ncbi:hypothetical protein ABC347_03315 [Sphingomonas sp. 1P06PA]|uniref:hypothetical protein n=1 Tax=Sphingomonas sp. 1P06PA TaxID=554121 RepID=UPI0039A5AFF1
MGAVEALVAGELDGPVDPRVTAFAEAIAARHGTASRAVLFYGSCLRSAELDGQMLDFYLIVSSYHAAYGGGWKALANRLLPPNVFPATHEGLAAKYAVLSEADFKRETGLGARDVSTMARFAQPARLVWKADRAAEGITLAAVAQASRSLLALTVPTLERGIADDPEAAWRAAFRLTYRCELRAERAARPDAIVDADPARYAALGRLVAAEAPRLGSPSVGSGWAAWARRGRRRQVMKLIKASTTFAGGIDYLAWKINRHAGTDIAIRPWQRRWPLLGAMALLPRLMAKGAVR